MTDLNESNRLHSVRSAVVPEILAECVGII